MGYYRGDGVNYYRGDYYRGDPFLAALAGRVAGRVIGRVGAFVGGKILGRAGRAVGAVAREAVPSVIAGATGVAIGRQMGPGMPMESLPGLGPLEGPGGTTKGQRARKKLTGVGGVTRRRMNALNPKALRRALRRAEGFEKFAKRTVNAMYRVIDGRKVRTFKKRKSS